MKAVFPGNKCEQTVSGDMSGKEAQGMLTNVRCLKQVAVSGETLQQINSRNTESCIIQKQVGQLADMQGLLLPLSFYEKWASVGQRAILKECFLGGREDSELILQTIASLK